MATQDRNTTGWFTAAEVAEAMQLSEQEFLRAYLDGPDDELQYWSGEPQIHWFSLVTWFEEYYTKTSTVNAESHGVQTSVAFGRSLEEAIEIWKREDGKDAARDLLEELLGLDAWSDGHNGRVATHWNMDTLDYDVESVPDGM